MGGWFIPLNNLKIYKDFNLKIIYITNSFKMLGLNLIDNYTIDFKIISNFNLNLYKVILSKNVKKINFFCFKKSNKKN